MKLAATIVVDLKAIVELVTTLVGILTSATLSQDDIQDCGPVYVSLVQLLTNLLISISGSCQPGTYFYVSPHYRCSFLTGHDFHRSN